MFYIAMIGLSLAGFIFFMCTILPVWLSIKQIRYMWWWFIICLAIFTFYAEPSASDDLSRYYMAIERMRNGTYHDIQPLFLWYIIEAIVAKVGVNGFLPAGTVLAVGFSGDQIIKDNAECLKDDNKNIVLFITLLFSCVSMLAIISGIKNALAASVFGFAYSKFYQTNLKKFFCMVLPLCFLHYSVIIVLFFLLIYRMSLRLPSPIRKFVYILCCTWTFFANKLELFFLRFSSIYISMIGRKSQDYQDFGALEGKWTFVLNINIILLCTIIVINGYRNKQEDTDGFVLFYLIAMIFSAAVYPILLQRGLMYVGFLTLPYLHHTRRGISKLLKRILIFTSGFYALVHIHAVFVFISFNGVNFIKLMG